MQDVHTCTRCSCFLLTAASNPPPVFLSPRLIAPDAPSCWPTRCQQNSDALPAVVLSVVKMNTRHWQAAKTSTKHDSWYPFRSITELPSTVQTTSSSFSSIDGLFTLAREFSFRLSRLKKQRTTMRKLTEKKAANQGCRTTPSVMLLIQTNVLSQQRSSLLVVLLRGISKSRSRGRLPVGLGSSNRIPCQRETLRNGCFKTNRVLTVQA